jgi:hypothetical protein
VLHELRYRYPSVVKLPLIGDFIHAHHIMHRFMQPSATKCNQVCRAVAHQLRYRYPSATKRNQVCRVLFLRFPMCQGNIKLVFRLPGYRDVGGGFLCL